MGSVDSDSGWNLQFFSKPQDGAEHSLYVHVYGVLIRKAWPV